ncbi:MAG TPA: pectinesterase family protein [Bryobacteraceae bacterium]|nr:pectinesterase family protein [Bryobacteraceae bacterium]
MAWRDTVSRRTMLATAFALSISHASPKRLSVSKKGGRFRTVQEAIDAVPPRNTTPYLIEIGPGRYVERLTIPRDKPFVRLAGQDARSTLLTYNLSTATTAETRYSASSYVFADDFQAENLTFENSYGTGSQAVALFVGADRAVFRNCRFLGWQDTLYVNGPGCHFVPQPLAAVDASSCPAGRHYFDQCYIEGHVDFIFGDAAAVFHQCQIHSKGPGYLTAQSRTYPEQTSGFVFDTCRLTGENTGAGVYLGRPWRAFSHVVYRDCWLGPHIRPEGWSVWNDNHNHETSFYAEYQSQGPGADPQHRVSWSHQLTAERAASYAAANFLRGSDGWQPAS